MRLLRVVFRFLKLSKEERQFLQRPILDETRTVQERIESIEKLCEYDRLFSQGFWTTLPFSIFLLFTTIWFLLLLVKCNGNVVLAVHAFLPKGLVIPNVLAYLFFKFWKQFALFRFDTEKLPQWTLGTVGKVFFFTAALQLFNTWPLLQTSLSLSYKLRLFFSPTSFFLPFLLFLGTLLDLKKLTSYRLDVHDELRVSLLPFLKSLSLGSLVQDALHLKLNLERRTEESLVNPKMRESGNKTQEEFHFLHVPMEISFRLSENTKFNVTLTERQYLQKSTVRKGKKTKYKSKLKTKSKLQLAADPRFYNLLQSNSLENSSGLRSQTSKSKTQGHFPDFSDNVAPWKVFLGIVGEGFRPFHRNIEIVEH